MANEDVAKYLLKARLNNPLAVYIVNNSVRENDIMRRLREKTVQEVEQYLMISAPEQVQFISMLLKLMNAKKAIEIGVFTGYNILSIAMALPKDGKVIGCDISTDYVNMGKPFFAEAGVSDKIDLRIQPAVKTLDELITAGEGGTFDFVYIDADKPSYITYYEKALQLVRTGGLIGLDNLSSGVTAVYYKRLFHLVINGSFRVQIWDLSSQRSPLMKTLVRSVISLNLEKALQLVRTGGLIGIDNVFWDAKVLNPELYNDEKTTAIVKLNAKIHKDSRVEMSLVPFADGLTLCRKL